MLTAILLNLGDNEQAWQKNFSCVITLDMWSRLHSWWIYTRKDILGADCMLFDWKNGNHFFFYNYFCVFRYNQYYLSLNLIIYLNTFKAEMIPTLMRSGGVGAFSTFSRFGALLGKLIY